MSSRPVYRMCAQVAPSGEYLRGHGRVAVDVTTLRRLWQHLPVLGFVILACVPVYAVVVAVCQLLNKGYYYYKGPGANFNFLKRTNRTRGGPAYQIPSK